MAYEHRQPRKASPLHRGPVRLRAEAEFVEESADAGMEKEGGSQGRFSKKKQTPRLTNSPALLSSPFISEEWDHLEEVRLEGGKGKRGKASVRRFRGRLAMLISSHTSTSYTVVRNKYSCIRQITAVFRM